MSRGPNATGPSHDPSLWIIHYSQAEPQHRLPANRIPIQPEIHKILHERRWIESQGQLIRKPFMLHDRYSWPTIEFPAGVQMSAGGMQAGPVNGPNPMQMGMGRPPQYFAQNPGGNMGPSPAKRARQGPPPSLAGAGVMAPPMVARDTSIEDEENTALGDILDNLTPQEISRMRFTQHHEWLEEVYSSQYTAGKIVPVDLGLGLMGELSHLTEGILDAPGAQPTKENPRWGAKPQRYRKLEPAQIAEFEARVGKYLQEANDELTQMKKEHEQRMAEMNRSKIYMRAETRLRDAVWDENEAGADAARPDLLSEDASSSNGRREGRNGVKTVDKIVGDVERALGITMVPRQEVLCVEKGGLLEEDKDDAYVNGNGNAAGEGEPMNGVSQAPMVADQMMTTSALASFAPTPLQATPAADATGGLVSNPLSQNQSAAATPSANVGGQEQGAPLLTQNELQAPLAAADEADLSLMEGIDMDVDMGGLQQPGDDQAGEADWVMVGQEGEGGAGATDGQALDVVTTAVTTAAELAPMSLQPTTSADVAATATATDAQADGTPGMFDSTDFDGLGALDTPGDGLVDYTGGADDLGLDLDNSAFGDAFHGTTPQPEAEAVVGEGNNSAENPDAPVS